MCAITIAPRVEQNHSKVDKRFNSFKRNCGAASVRSRNECLVYQQS